MTCVNAIQNGDVGLLEFEEMGTEAKFLEQLGYLTSSECDRGILIRVNGHFKTDEEVDFFCVKMDDHHV